MKKIWILIFVLLMSVNSYAYLYTSDYGFYLPQVGQDTFVWGDLLNSNWDSMVIELDNVYDTFSNYTNKSDSTYDNPTAVSELTNDSNFVSVGDNISNLVNDSGFISAVSVSDIPDSYVKNFESDTIDGTLTATGIITNLIELSDGYINSILCSTLKVHQTDTVTPVTSVWTPFTFSDTITDETQGSMFEVYEDSTIRINDTGIYNFGGCVHIHNFSGGNVEAIIGSRIMVKDIEARCGQRAWANTLKNDGEITLTFNGTAYFDYGDTIQLQYYSNTANIRFISNAVFDNQVAATLWLRKCDKGTLK